MTQPFMKYFGETTSAARVAAADKAFAELLKKVTTDVDSALRTRKENQALPPINATTELLLKSHATNYAERARKEPNLSDGVSKSRELRLAKLTRKEPNPSDEVLKSRALRLAEHALNRMFKEHGLEAVGAAVLDYVDENIKPCKPDFSPYLAKRAAAHRSR
jgi:hypothetical protein